MNKIRLCWRHRQTGRLGVGPWCDESMRKTLTILIEARKAAHGASTHWIEDFDYLMDSGDALPVCESL